MKKFFAALLSLALAMSLFACGNEAPAQEPVSEEVSEEASGEVSKEVSEEAPAEEVPFLETLDVKYVSPNEKADYSSVCDMDPAYTTNGKVSFTNMVTIDGDDYYPAKEGYEWQIAEINFFFYDEYAFDCGYTYSGGWVNYYGEEYMDEAKEVKAVRFNGELYPIDERFDFMDGPYTEGEIARTIKYAVQVPKGFDGIVWEAIKLYEPGVIPPYEEYVRDDATVFSKHAA